MKILQSPGMSVTAVAATSWELGAVMGEKHCNKSFLRETFLPSSMEEGDNKIYKKEPWKNKQTKLRNSA